MIWWLSEVCNYEPTFTYTFSCSLTNRSFFYHARQLSQNCRRNLKHLPGTIFYIHILLIFLHRNFQLVTIFEGNHHLINSRHGFSNNWCWENMTEMVNIRLQFEKTVAANSSKSFSKALLLKCDYYYYCCCLLLLLLSLLLYFLLTFA